MNITQLEASPGRLIDTVEVHVFERTHRYLHELPPLTAKVSFAAGDWCRAWLGNNEALEPFYSEYFEIDSIREISNGVYRIIDKTGRAFDSASIMLGLTKTEKERAIQNGSIERPYPVIPYSLIADAVMDAEFDILSLVG